MLGLCVRSHYLCISSVSKQHETVSYVNVTNQHSFIIHGGFMKNRLEDTSLLGIINS